MEEKMRNAMLRATFERGGTGIGTMGEKIMHLGLKYYFAPDRSTHEQPLAGYIADAVTEDGVIEVQTRALYRLKPKLASFLPLMPVTVVHPVIEDKQILYWGERAETLRIRKSPKHENIFSALGEIYSLRDYVLHPNLRIILIGFAVEEDSIIHYKGGRVRGDRRVTDVREQRVLQSPADYAAVLPPMPESFTAAETAKLLHIPLDAARRMLCLYGKIGLMRGDGKRPQHWSRTDSA